MRGAGPGGIEFGQRREHVVDVHDGGLRAGQPAQARERRHRVRVGRPFRQDRAPVLPPQGRMRQHLARVAEYVAGPGERQGRIGLDGCLSNLLANLLERPKPAGRAAVTQSGPCA